MCYEYFHSFLCSDTVYYRINIAFCRFKLEEKTRYVDRLTNVELREAHMKGLNNYLCLFVLVCVCIPSIVTVRYVLI